MWKISVKKEDASKLQALTIDEINGYNGYKLEQFYKYLANN